MENLGQFDTTIGDCRENEVVRPLMIRCDF
jgi:hypothetical protein